MPTQAPDEQLRNNFGTRATHPIGEGEVEGDRYQNDGSGLLLAGKYWYHSGAWILSPGGGGGTNVGEHPDAFHFFKTAGQAPEGSAPITGYPSQRCIAKSSDTYNNHYYLFHNSGVGNKLILLRIEHLSTTPGMKTALDRCVWDVEVNINEAYMPGDTPGTWELVSIRPWDFCLVIDDNDILHIICIAEAADGSDRVIDVVCDISAHSVLQEPSYATAVAPPEPMSITIIAETVTSLLSDNENCQHVTAAFTAHSLANPIGSTVIVGWEQSTAPAPYGIYTNAYDPAQAPGSRYPGVQALVDADASWPTIEVGGTYVYMTYVANSEPKFATSPFDYTTWNILAPGTGINDLIANCPSTTHPMSMCVARYTDTIDVIYFVIEDDDAGQGEKFLVVLLEDFLVTSIGASYNISVYDTFNPIESQMYFQLGINKIAWSSGENAPTLFMLHGKRGLPIGSDYGPLEMHMTILSPDLTDGFIASDLPVSPAGASTSDQGSLEAICTPMIHYAYEAYNRPWDGNPDVYYNYYPIMVYATLSIYSWDIGNSKFLHSISLWIKDIPEYPYIGVVMAY